MKPPIVKVPSTKSIIQPAAGFKKKDLADNKVDLMALCWYGCRYCSSNHGTYIRTNWESGENFKALAEKQLGRKVSKKEFFSMNLVWPDVIEKLQNQLSEVSNNFGKDKVLVFSELTDGFSPKLVEDRTTRQALELLIGKTSFLIRVLTKNAVVGEPEWIEYFLEHKDRFTVGLSTGSLDDKWSKKMELGTSPPSERLQALKNLQEAGVSTYGMLCPVFPDMVMENRIVELVEQINPNVVEYVWAEPYNDRDNWELVQKSYSNGSKYYN